MACFSIPFALLWSIGHRQCSPTCRRLGLVVLIHPILVLPVADLVELACVFWPSFLFFFPCKFQKRACLVTLSCCFLTACRQLNGVGYHVELLGCDVSPLQATVLNSVRLPEQFVSTHKFILLGGESAEFLVQKHNAMALPRAQAHTVRSGVWRASNWTHG